MVTVFAQVDVLLYHSLVALVILYLQTNFMIFFDSRLTIFSKI